MIARPSLVTSPFLLTPVSCPHSKRLIDQLDVRELFYSGPKSLVCILCYDLKSRPRNIKEFRPGSACQVLSVIAYYFIKGVGIHEPSSFVELAILEFDNHSQGDSKPIFWGESWQILCSPYW